MAGNSPLTAATRQYPYKLRYPLAGFVGTLNALGTHLRNAYTKDDDNQKRLDRLGLQLTQIQADQAPESLGN